MNYIYSAGTRGVVTGKQTPKVRDYKTGKKYLKTNASKELIGAYFNSKDFKRLMYLSGVLMLIENGNKKIWNNLPFDYTHFSKDN